MTKVKGFGMLDMLVVIFIVASLTVVTAKKYVVPDMDYIYLSNDIIESHVDALTDHVLNNVSNSYTNDNIYFNETGNINKGQTIDISNRKIVLHLGNGYMVNE